ncbi:TonB-dependent receptor [Emticicia oligotrophica DSM 17448]|uniref:TonB-dependent receptor n=1 Tax=Emticicia oligotrophica (strain DSM 17448 / CIP 109782 / MTCC 6937 / GPTSA100-15) TaxID=929562 RepID=A0ABM5MYF9_EMTOG|nr:TonB-dependent receptor [Emticicia oligotrophica]AFK02197.1 TonB-dependent receptor [Emticicia oligotrophica DSM 17448]
MKIKYILLLFASTVKVVFAQQKDDSVRVLKLEEIQVKEQYFKYNIDNLPVKKGTYLYGGKKTELINVLGLDANIAEKTPRQIFAKVPGVFVYDMDGSGNQINISTRGLDPHRGWEFNVRKDGVITNTDMYGYPASHYSMPMEAIQTIELVRGTGSLQYGAQFGGMLNYIAKRGDSTKVFDFESTNSVGSFGLLSTYNAIGGQVGKANYYAYYSKRVSDGYRDNSRSNYDAFSTQITYQATKNLAIKADLSHSKYVIQLAGQQTDAMFEANPRASTRSRNYYSPDIYVPSISLNWAISNRTKISWVNSAVLGSRNSVMFDKAADIVDKIDPITIQYANRQVDIDNYHSYTSELRLLHEYQIGKMPSVLVSGVQMINNDLHRRQQGKGTTGSNYDLSITGDWGRDLHFKTQNIAAFLENRINITPKLAISPGLRVESGESKMLGKISYYDPAKLPNNIVHRFPLFGVSADYQISTKQNLYGGFSQAYRPVIFKDIIPASVYEKSSDNLKDAYGYNFELGYKGNFDKLRVEMTYFQLLYKNRLGTLAETDAKGNLTILRTNIGDSFSKGLETFLEYYGQINEKIKFSIFTSTALMDARYLEAEVRSGDKNVNVKGNAVESTPKVISRNGITFRYKKLSITGLYSYTAKSYADALNTVEPSANGSVGLVPAYGIIDINASYRVSKKLLLKFNFNNASNKQYFTKRPQFYPGPGIWASDGRGFNLTISTHL